MLQVGEVELLLRALKDQVTREQSLLDASQQLDLYSALDLTPSATPAQIKEAHRRLVLAFHPDKYTGDEPEFAARRFGEVTEAYSVLGNAVLRAQYDSGRQPEGSASGYSFSFDVNSGGAEGERHEGWRTAANGMRERAYVHTPADTTSSKCGTGRLLCLDRRTVPKPKQARHTRRGAAPRKAHAMRSTPSHDCISSQSPPPAPVTPYPIPSRLVHSRLGS